MTELLSPFPLGLRDFRLPNHGSGWEKIVELEKKSHEEIKEKRTKKIILSGSQIFLCAAMMNQPEASGKKKQN